MNAPIADSLPPDPAELLDLFSVVRDETATPEQFHRLEDVLRADDESVALFVRLMRVHALFERNFEIPVESDAEAPYSQNTETCADSEHVVPSTLPSPLSPLHSPLSTYFSSGWPIAYLIATVVFAIGLVIGAIVHVSQPDKYVGPRNSVRAPNPQSPIPHPSSIVAHVTGMLDCEWEGTGARVQGTGAANHQSEIINQKSEIRLGDRLSLRSGLLELTYDTGARVILQGPVAYQVESPAGGYLSVGKLTAKLEKKAESPSLSPIPSPLSTLFAIRTPTAIVTDLGTEFGVEVDKSGSTKSYVFRGLVQVQAVSHDGKPYGDAHVLHEKESAAVETPDGGPNRGSRVTVSRVSADPAAFIRALPEAVHKTIDLVDVVAGGDGHGHNRHRGIDPNSGAIIDRPAPTDPKWDLVQSDGRYHKVKDMPFVDGVFVPDDRRGPVQLDSAGHTFAAFGSSDSHVFGHIWAGGPIPAPNDDRTRTQLGGIDYASSGHGVLGMVSNKGITFDLAAIRQANTRAGKMHFRAIVGNSGSRNSFNSKNALKLRADVWVFVDGLRRWRIQTDDFIPHPIDIAIGKNDRFLTLVVSDGGDLIDGDRIIFGDPRLELTADSATESTNRQPVTK